MGRRFSRALTPFLSAADIAFGNLEGVLMDGGEAVKRCRPAKTTKREPSAGARTGLPPAPAPTPAAPPDGDDDPGPRTVDAADGDDRRPRTITALPAGATSRRRPQRTPQPIPPHRRRLLRLPFTHRYATWLRDAGFDVMSLANNHAQDFGDPGRASSMQALDAVGIRHSGRDGDIAEVDHARPALRARRVRAERRLASTQRPDPRPGNRHRARRETRHRHRLLPWRRRGRWRAEAPLRARALRRRGSRRCRRSSPTPSSTPAPDLVLGSGPHVMRAIELYRDRLIAYSLGNFATYYGDQRKRHSGHVRRAHHSNGRRRSFHGSALRPDRADPPRWPTAGPAKARTTTASRPDDGSLSRRQPERA